MSCRENTPWQSPLKCVYSSYVLKPTLLYYRGSLMSIRAMTGCVNYAWAPVCSLPCITFHLICGVFCVLGVCECLWGTWVGDSSHSHKGAWPHTKQQWNARRSAAPSQHNAVIAPHQDRVFHHSSPRRCWRSHSTRQVRWVVMMMMMMISGPIMKKNQKRIPWGDSEVPELVTRFDYWEEDSLKNWENVAHDVKSCNPRVNNQWIIPEQTTNHFCALTRASVSWHFCCQ